MTTFSQLTNSSDILIDTITIGATGTSYQYNFSNIASTASLSYNTLTSVSATGAYTISSGDINTGYTFNWTNEEWIDTFPSWNRVNQMCEKYPSLEIALRNFKTVYNLVKDDYDNPKDEK